MDSLMHPWILALAVLPPLALAFLLLRVKRTPNSKTMYFPVPKEFWQRALKRTRRIHRALAGLTLIALLILAYAAARPVLEKPRVSKEAEGIDIGIVFDVSESMEADDFEPNRFVVAKKVVRDFIERRVDDRLAFVTFSGDTVTKSPLTRDQEFLKSQIDDLRLRELKQGTAIGMGLANGIARLKNSKAKTRIIVLLTDGDSNVGAINPITAAQLARQQGIRIYTIGIGKSNRVVVPIYSYDIYGRRSQLVAQVPSYLNPELLQDIAQITGGKAYMARDAGMLSTMLQEIDRLERTKIKISKTTEREERFLPYALAACLLIFCLALLRETRFQRVRFA